ncbi:ATP-binding region, ATPase-like domain protein [Candidatus Magnetoovum chiemensis]|nr:ATP-binding region, ATPase-like domain protein [Candidatus Magnetoovum chiemensis]
MENQKIQIIETNNELSSFLSPLLEQEGFYIKTVKAYSDGEIIGNIIANIENGFRIIILPNTFLPKLATDGINLLRLIKQTRQTLHDTAIVLIVERYNKEILNHAISELGIDLILKQPIDTHYLKSYLIKTRLMFKLEQDLLKDKGIFKTIVDQFPAPVSLIDHRYKVLYVNEAQKKLTQNVNSGQRCYISMAAGLSRGLVPCAPCAVTKTLNSGLEEIITRWGTKKDGTHWHSIQKSSPIKINDQVIATIKTVEDRTDLLQSIESEKNPDVKLKRRIDEILRYMLKSGFSRAIFYEIKQVVEGGYILLTRSSIGLSDKEKETISPIFLTLDDPAFKRIANYTNNLSDNDKYKKIPYTIIISDEEAPFIALTDNSEDAYRLEIPFIVNDQTVSLLIFDNEPAQDRILKKDKVEYSLTSIKDVEELIPFIINSLSYMETIWRDIQERKTIAVDRYLLSLAEELAYLREEDEFYQVFIEKACAFLGAVEGLIMSFDDKQNRLRKKAWLGSHTQMWCDFSIENCSFPCCQTAIKGKRTIIQDFSNYSLKENIFKECIHHIADPSYLDKIKGWLNEVSSWACFPIKVEEELLTSKFLGTVAFQSSEKFFFTDERADFIERAIRIAGLVLSRIQAEETKEMASAANAQLQIALRTVHNLRTPSTAARNYLEVLAEWIQGQRTFSNKDKSEDTKEANIILDKALDQLQRIERLASDIQTLLKPLKLRSAPVNIVKLIVDTIEDIIAPQKSLITSSYNYTNDNIQINADTDSIKEVFEQFVENAVRAMDGKQRKALTVNITMEDNAPAMNKNIRKIEGKHVIIYFGDTGKGMPLEIRDRIFEPWVSASPSSTGLGLAITKKIIEEHEGNIWLEKSDNNGTVFAIALPVL